MLQSKGSQKVNQKAITNIWTRCPPPSNND